MVETAQSVAQQAHDDIWDIFGTLTREQSASVMAYFKNLEMQGILRLPEPGVGELGDQTKPAIDKA